MTTNNISALLPIEEREEKQLVNARMLHEFLGVGTDFRHWIRRRINDGSFIEDRDYAIHRSNLTETQGGRPATDYGLTMRMAEHICMMERTQKGEEARDYFIECEKKVKAMVPQLPGDYLGALKALVASEEEKFQLAAQNKKLSGHLADTVEEKQTLLDITKPHSYIRIGDAAKIINCPGLGPNNMFKFLCKHGFLRKIDREDKSYTFYQKYAKYFRERATQQTGGHEGMKYYQVVINMNGLVALHRKILQEKGPWGNMKTKEELIAEFSEKEEKEER